MCRSLRLSDVCALPAAPVTQLRFRDRPGVNQERRPLSGTSLTDGFLVDLNSVARGYRGSGRIILIAGGGPIGTGNWEFEMPTLRENTSFAIYTFRLLSSEMNITRDGHAEAAMTLSPYV